MNMMRWGFSEHDDVGDSVNMMRWGFSELGEVGVQ